MVNPQFRLVVCDSHWMCKGSIVLLLEKLVSTSPTVAFFIASDFSYIISTMVLVTSCLRGSNKFRINLLKVSVSACESGQRLAAPLPRITCAGSAKGFKFL